MKISDGFWMNRPGYSVSYATQICGIEADDRSVTVYAAAHWVKNRGMTLGGPLFTVRFTSTLRNSIKVTIEHFSGVPGKSPSFQLYEDTDFTPVITPVNGGYELVQAVQASA